MSRRLYAYQRIQEQDWESLKELSRIELEQQLSANPGDPIYVTPGISVMGVKADAAFYAEVERRRGPRRPIWSRSRSRPPTPQAELQRAQAGSGPEGWTMGHRGSSTPCCLW